MRAKSLQSCPTLCDPTDCSPLGSPVHGDSPGKNTGVGCHFLLQGIFPTQGLNLHVLHGWAYALPLTHLKKCCCSVVSDSLRPPWTVARQAPLSMGCSRQEYRSRLPYPPVGSSPPGDRTCVSYVSCIGRRVPYRERHLGNPSAHV